MDGYIVYRLACRCLLVGMFGVWALTLTALAIDALELYLDAILSGSL